MTIISVVYVAEGIAMAADSMLTKVVIQENGTREKFTLTSNAQKLLTFRNSTIGISCCGSAIIDGKTVSDFLRIFDIQHVRSDDTVEIIANKLHYYLKHYKEYRPVFYLAGFDHDQPYVFTLDKDIIIRMSVNKEKQLLYGASWIGDTDGADKLFKAAKINYLLMPLKDAVDYAEFIIEANIKYHRFTDRIPTCGGPIDLLVITKDYTKFLRHKILH